jgi:hypothetical protein
MPQPTPVADLGSAPATGTDCYWRVAREQAAAPVGHLTASGWSARSAYSDGS